MSKDTWHSGPPPSIGWWPASWAFNCNTYRWYDGGLWSRAAQTQCDVKRAARIAATPESPELQYLIQWQERPASWPARSRT